MEKRIKKDKKALSLLKRYNPWSYVEKNRLTEEELKYCIEKGVMYERLTISHEVAVDEIISLANSIPIEEAANAFLYSLSSGENQYRTVLSSVILGRALKQHYSDMEDEYAGRACNVCGLIMDSEGQNCDINFNYYSKFRYFSGEQNITLGGYVFLDLREYKKLPKIKYCEEDIKIINRIFGLAAELGPSNKFVALQKLITAEKFFKATKNEINCILQVLAVCGVFDTPEHKGIATQFTTNKQEKIFVSSDWAYPLDYWRGKYGINYDAVENIFGGLVGKQLNREQCIKGEVKRKEPEKKKQSKAEKYFTEGTHFIELDNKDRYYYGLSELNPKWDKLTRYSVTHCCYKRSEIYFEGDVVKKVIYEENIGETKFLYQEIDMEVNTVERKLIIPKTTRGRKQPLTPANLLTPTYMQGHLAVDLCNRHLKTDVECSNSANEQYLPLPEGKILSNEDFQEYTKKYIADLPEDYGEVIANFRNKKRVTIKFHSGAVFRIQLTPRTYTYALILGKVREILNWKEVPESHPLQGCMAQPIMYRVYDIITENKNMTIEELEKVPLRPLEIAYDNQIFWETFPIIGYKKLKETDIDLGFSLQKNKVIMGFGIYECEENLFEDITDISYEGIHLGIWAFDKLSAHMIERKELQKEVEKRLGLNHENAVDEFAKRYDGITRKDFIRFLEERELR